MVTDTTRMPMTGSGIVNEQTVIVLRAHGRRLFWPALALVVLSGVWAYTAGRFDAGWMHASEAIVWLALVFLLSIYPWLRWLAERTTITTARVITTRGLVVRERKDVLFVRVTDVTLRRTPGQLMFGAGDILLGRGAEEPVRLHSLPRAAAVHSALTELVHGAHPSGF